MSPSPTPLPFVLLPLVFALALGLLDPGASLAQSPSPGASANPFDVAAGHPQAPYGDAMPPIVKNYLRASPYVGTGGVIREGALGDLAGLGFKTLVNLVTPEEGAEAERGPAEAVGLTYVSIPIAGGAPTEAEIARLAEIVEEPFNYPVLVHCRSSNRVGAAWALYRAASGVPAEIAIQEGRTVGLKPSRETAVREVLGLPPLER